QSWIVRIAIEVLMFSHRRNADQVSLFPIPSCAVVDVMTAPFDDENLLLGHVPVFAGAASRENFLHLQPHSSSRPLHFRMSEPFQSSLTAPFPRLLFVRNHMRHRVAEN